MRFSFIEGNHRAFVLFILLMNITVLAGGDNKVCLGHINPSPTLICNSVVNNTAVGAIICCGIRFAWPGAMTILQGVSLKYYLTKSTFFHMTYWDAIDRCVSLFINDPVLVLWGEDFLTIGVNQLSNSNTEWFEYLVKQRVWWACELLQAGPPRDDYLAVHDGLRMMEDVETLIAGFRFNIEQWQKNS